VFLASDGSRAITGQEILVETRLGSWVKPVILFAIGLENRARPQPAAAAEPPAPELPPVWKWRRGKGEEERFDQADASLGLSG